VILRLSLSSPTQITLSALDEQMKDFIRCYHSSKYENNVELLWKKCCDEIFMSEIFPLEGGYKCQIVASSFVSPWLCGNDGMWGSGGGL
jgi:hypothetical protein